MNNESNCQVIAKTIMLYIHYLNIFEHAVSYISKEMNKFPNSITIKHLATILKEKKHTRKHYYHLQKKLAQDY